MSNSRSYQQPDEADFQGRSLDGILERVVYSLNSNIRIWYNTQHEGYATHQHSAMEIIIPMEKNYTIIVSDQSFLLKPGDIFFVPRLAIHEILPAECGSRFICMFNMEPLSRFHDSSTLNPVLMEPRIINRETFPSIYEQLYSRFMQITDIYFSNITFWEYSIYAILIEILTTIGREHYQSFAAFDSSQEKQYEYYQKFTSLLSYIDTCYAEDLTLEKMAAFMGFSKYHFARLFKEHTNSTYYDYLSRKRIQAAQTLLATEQSITEIAFQTGFHNSTSFGRCFKKYTKYSPTEYRTLFVLHRNSQISPF